MRKDTLDRPLTYKKDNGDYYRVAKVSNRFIPTKEYEYWVNMHRRVSPDYKTRFPSYNDMTVSEEFKDFNTFVEWCKLQVGYDQKGYVLDKDILGTLLGTKSYCKTACIFVPQAINIFVAIRNRAVKHYTGVSFQQSCQKYIVSCSQLNAKNKTLARVNCPKEGYEIYKAEKVRLAKVLADEYKGQVDDRVIEILSNFENYIDLFTVNPTNKGDNT